MTTATQRKHNARIPTDFNALESFAWGHSHFFDPRTRRFFKSRPVGEPRREPRSKAVYFIDSTKSGFDDPTRSYNLHRASFEKDRGRYALSVSPPLERYRTRAQALRALAETVEGAKA